MGYHTVMCFSLWLLFVFSMPSVTRLEWTCESPVENLSCISCTMFFTGFFAVCIHAAVSNTSGTAGISVRAPSQCLWPLEQPAEAGNAKIRLHLHNTEDNTVQMSLSVIRLKLLWHCSFNFYFMTQSYGALWQKKQGLAKLAIQLLFKESM